MQPARSVVADRQALSGVRSPAKAASILRETDQIIVTSSVTWPSYIAMRCGRTRHGCARRCKHACSPLQNRALDIKPRANAKQQRSQRHQTGKNKEKFDLGQTL